MTLGGLLMAGCRPDHHEAPVVVTDSAGIEIVSNTLSMEAIPEFRVSEPVLSIGSVEGPPEQQLFMVMDGIRLADGRIVVLNSGTQELRYYDAEGRFLSAQGRQGDGPGEYRFPYRVFRLPGDSLLVYDIALVRFTVIDPTGQAVRTFFPSKALYNEPQFAGLIGDSVAVTHERIFDIPARGFDTMYTRVAFSQLDGNATDTLMLPDARMGTIGPAGGRGFVGSPHFEPRTSLVTDSDGLWVGSGRSPEVSRYDTEGHVDRIVRWNAPLQTVRQSDVTRRIEELVEDRGERSEELRRWYRDVPAAQTFPVYEELFTDRQGQMWIAEYDGTEQQQTRRWLVFDSGGRLIRRVRLPAALRLLEIGSDYLLAVQPDELDVEYVRLWRREEPMSSSH